MDPTDDAPGRSEPEPEPGLEQPRRLEAAVGSTAELNELVRQLNAQASTSSPTTRPSPPDSPAAAGSSEAPRASPRATARAALRNDWQLERPARDARAATDALLEQARRLEASDLLLVVGRPPTVRVHGRLEALPGPPLTPERCASLCSSLVPAGRRDTLASTGATDFGLERPTSGRLRANVHRERGRWAAAVRLLPTALPELRALGLPEVLADLADRVSGLLLVTGATGSGKSTTLAALVRHLLKRRALHAITIEDPVEFVHEHGQGLVEHVEIGRDAVSFPAALRSALRQDPDVLLVGEMRDPESMAMALSAAETGHLVLSTLHVRDCAQSISRIVDAFPTREAEPVRTQLAAALNAVVAQRLVPRRDGRGRVPASEVLVATPAVRNLIRRGRLEQLRSQMASERATGMLELERDLARLVHEGAIAEEEARRQAAEPAALDAYLGGGP